MARVVLLSFCSFFSVRAAQPIYISEILFNPPGTDNPNEYVELRGPPNLVLEAHTYLVAIEGNAEANPGTIQNVFDLSGVRIGGNGFLLLLQKGNDYLADPGATLLTYSGPGSGWGNSSSGPLIHQGRNGITDLGNPSVTYMLVDSATAPVLSLDIDANDDGRTDGTTFSTWIVLDSIGVLDSDGAGDIAYGKINFRRNTTPGSTATASGRIFGLPFTPRYVGRHGNSTGWTESDWIAGDGLGGAAPNWSLGPETNTWPANFARQPLSHLGAPNFGAPALPGVVVRQTGVTTEVSKTGLTDSYTISLTTEPMGIVTIVASTRPPVQLSIDGGTNFASDAIVILTNTAPRTVTVAAMPDGRIDTAWHLVTHIVAGTTDTRAYPTNTVIPDVPVKVKEFLFLNELKVNPPGADGGFEYIELRGAAGSLVSNTFLLELEGDSSMNPGRVTYLRDLSGERVGINGLMFIVADENVYASQSGTTVLQEPLFRGPDGNLSNGSTSFLLVSSPSPIRFEADLDQENDGVLEGLSPDAAILDAVGWSDGGKNDVVYGGVELKGSPGTPDAAARRPGNLAAASVEAWFYGDLAATDGSGLLFDEGTVNASFPTGTLLTPGAENRIAPTISRLNPTAISGVVGDSGNPDIDLILGAGEWSGDLPAVTATSTNQSVLPDTNIFIFPSSGSQRRLHLEPIGIGYSEIAVCVRDGYMSNRASFVYAASRPTRNAGSWHIGASDGSTAIPLGPGFMLVGDDENQVVRLFARERSGLALNQFDFTSNLQLPDAESGFPREVDIEASTRAGDVLFWIGSHGHSAVGEPRTNRTRVFGAAVSGTGGQSTLSYVGRYDYLKLDLIRWDQLNQHGKGTNYYGFEASDAEGVPPKAPDGSGFAIEGLAMMPDNMDGAYLGFRAPIVSPTNRTYALILPVLNFATLALSGGPPGSSVIGNPIELDLYGRGIRSIEGNTNGYIIIGGPPGGTVGAYPQDFRLYTWSGRPEDGAQERNADLSGLNPEGIVELPPEASPWNEDSQVNLLSDNGATEFYGDGVPAKALKVRNFKKCRSDWITIGRTVVPIPIITEIAQTPTGLKVRWRSLKGIGYLLLTSLNPSETTWTVLGGAIYAPGPFADVEAPIDGRQRFYRVSALDARP